MANVQPLQHKLTELNKLKLTVPDTVKRRVLRCDEAGDKFASAMYKASGGNYAEIAASLDSIVKKCNKIIDVVGKDAKGIREAAKDAKKKCSRQSEIAKDRRAKLKNFYDQTTDICSQINA